MAGGGPASGRADYSRNAGIRRGLAAAQATQPLRRRGSPAGRRLAGNPRQNRDLRSMLRLLFERTDRLDDQLPAFGGNCGAWPGQLNRQNRA